MFLTLRRVTYFERDSLHFENIAELQLVSYFIFMCINTLQSFKVKLIVKENQLDRHVLCVADLWWFMSKKYSDCSPSE